MSDVLRFYVAIMSMITVTIMIAFSEIWWLTVIGIVAILIICLSIVGSHRDKK